MSYEKALKYWLKKDGYEYAMQQRARTTHGDPSYSSQEDWVLKYIAARASRQNSPLRVLDYGCGFGRFTRLLAQLPNVEYYGFDISEAMTKPIFDDGSLANVHGRIFVGEDPRQKWATQSFDVILTVSVFIHQSREVAAKIAQLIGELLAPEGEICLIENTLCSITIRSSEWHDGCWLHNYAALFTGFDMSVLQRVLPEQDIYLLRRSSTLLPLYWLGTDLGDVAQVSHDTLLTLGGQLAEYIASLDQAQGDNGRAFDAAELFEAMSGEVQQWRSRMTLRSVIWSSIRERLDTSDPAPEEPWSFASGVAATYAWNHPQDVKYAQEDIRFSQVCHIFHLEWFGIRGAAGSLPGLKLGVSANLALSSKEIEDIVRRLQTEKVQRVVVHGMSPPMQRLIRAVHAALGIPMYLVWHGSLAQWFDERERTLAVSALALARGGLVRRIAMVRQGNWELSSRGYKRMLLNAPPRVAEHAKLVKPLNGRETVCLVAGWNNHNKNIHTNIMAAVLSDMVKTVLVYAAVGLPEALLRGKVRRVKYVTREDHFRLLQVIGLGLNVSVVDAHPMLDLEFMAHDIPCLSGPLWLDGLEDHPYLKVVRVQDPMSIAAIKCHIERVTQTPPQELHEMLGDFREQVRSTALDRYGDFLEL